MTMRGASAVCNNKPIGFGSYGVVWEVMDHKRGRKVALKKIEDVFNSPITAIMAFREIRMLSSFRHENVLAALEVMQPPPMDQFKDVYFTSELMDTNMHRLIYSKISLTADHIHLLMYQMMRGLKYIHSAQIIHRDIKPSNLLIRYNFQLKICDFGMARAEMKDKSKKMSLDVVTPSYRAPEIFMWAKQYTAAIDIWAAACVFFELLGRRNLFGSSSEITQIKQIVHLLGTPKMADIDYASRLMKNLVLRSPRKPSNIRSLQKLSPYVTEEAIDLISRMLTFSPTKRLSAEEVLEHPYLFRGRRLYHAALCKCCPSPRGVAVDFEPAATAVFDDRWEQEITSVLTARLKMQQYIRGQIYRR